MNNLYDHDINDPYTIYIQKNLLLQVIDYNATCLKYLGFKDKQEIIGKRDAELPWATLAAEYEKHDQDALSGLHYTTIVPVLLNNKVLLFSCWRYAEMSAKQKDRKIHVYFSEIVLPEHFNTPALEAKISSREMQCLWLLVRSYSAKEIAKLLSISPKTVETTLFRLKKKLNCKTKHELINAVIQNGLFQLFFNMPFIK